jgi:hypothetical protein
MRPAARDRETDRAVKDLKLAFMRRWDGEAIYESIWAVNPFNERGYVLLGSICSTHSRLVLIEPRREVFILIRDL